MADPARPLPDDASEPFLAGKRVLVTGGTGTFGQAFARYALTQGVDSLVVLSRDEFKQSEMRTAFPDPRMRWFLGDVRDRDRLRRAFEGVDLVIHAAALKRIEAGEQDAEEFVKTNVLGTMNVCSAAHDARVRRVVFLSTDKASQSSTLYGSTKHTAERLIVAANNTRGQSGPEYVATRYGNVSGSRGSVIPKWRALIANGHGIEVRDADATRYWMTLAEAVQLVAWTAAYAAAGAVVVPDLPAYRVGDLAEAMRPPTLVSSSLANGEKRHESMIGADELPLFRRHGPYWSTRGQGESLAAPLTSDTAPRLTVDEIRQRLEGL